MGAEGEVEKVVGPTDILPFEGEDEKVEVDGPGTGYRCCGCGCGEEGVEVGGATAEVGGAEVAGEGVKSVELGRGEDDVAAFEGCEDSRSGRFTGGCSYECPDLVDGGTCESPCTIKAHRLPLAPVTMTRYPRAACRKHIVTVR